MAEVINLFKFKEYKPSKEIREREFDKLNAEFKRIMADRKERIKQTKP